MWESCQLLAVGRWFPPGVTRFPPPLKLTRRDIAEISLKRRKALKSNQIKSNSTSKGIAGIVGIACTCNRLLRAHAITTACARNRLLRAHAITYCVRTQKLLRAHAKATACTRNNYCVRSQKVLRAHAIPTACARNRLLREHAIATACARNTYCVRTQ